METAKLGVGNYYDHTKKDDKHFFGGFLNLAVNNLDSVLRVFSEKFNKGKYFPARIFVQNCLKSDLADTEYNNRLDFLKFHLPVISFIKSQDNSRLVFNDDLNLLFAAIESLRNFYSHYYHKPLGFPYRLYTLIDSIFAEVVQVVKQHKMKDDKTRHLLSKNIYDELQFRFQQNLQKLKELNSQGKRVNLNDSLAIENSVLNGAFNHLVYKKDDTLFPTYNYESKYISKETPDNGIVLSQSGLIFLLSMFLTRKESEDLKSRVRGFKGKIIKDGEEGISSLKFMATHWVFSYLNFRIVKQKLNTDFTAETLLVQIIDELSKVPDEVYETFDKATKERFVEDINEYLKEENADMSYEELKVVHPIVRKRYESKFNYFAIRFLDEFADFKSLRFQIHLGNYVHDRRVKNITGTEFITERIIKERIKVFGKMSEIGALKADFLHTKRNQSEETGWELFPNPSYNFIGNNIPIYLSANTIKGELQEFRKIRASEQPDERKRRKEGKPEKYQITGEIAAKNQINYDEPMAVLSLNEIPALLYEILVKKVEPVKIEERLVQKLEERIKIIKNYDPVNPLAASLISKRLRFNDSQQLIDKEKLLHLLNRELETSNEKSEVINKNRSELRTKVNGKFLRKHLFTRAEMGEVAAWFANDLKRFMPEDARRDWKGYQHSQLQQSLAYYDIRNNEALSLLESVWDFNNENYSWNRWIKASFRHCSFEGFYERYFLARSIYFAELSENIVQYISDRKTLLKFLKQQLPNDFLDQRYYQDEPLQVEKMKILSKPLVFPRGIFDSKPTFIKGKSIIDDNELYADWYRFSYSSDHQFQKYYYWKRDYKDLFKNVLKNDNEFEKNGNGLSEAEQFDLLKMKQDLAIKKVKMQDLFLKLISENLFHKIFHYAPDLSLSDMYLTQEERLEKEKAAMIQGDRVKGDSSPNIINDNFIWSKSIPFEKSGVYEPHVKLKDLGKFKNFLLSHKVQRLLSYNIKPKWSKDELEAEINIGKNSYESIRRDELLKEIQQLEKTILEQYDSSSHPAELEHKSHPNFKLYICNGILRRFNIGEQYTDDDWLEKLGEVDFENLSITHLHTKSEEIRMAFFIILVRNKFAHNQFPAEHFYDYIRNNFSEIQGETVAQFYLNFFRYTKGFLLDRLQNH